MSADRVLIGYDITERRVSVREIDGADLGDLRALVAKCEGMPDNSRVLVSHLRPSTSYVAKNWVGLIEVTGGGESGDAL